jgi:hypothetical protein
MLDFADLIDFLSYGDFEWLYRGWLFLFARTYRQTVKESWTKLSTFSKILDIVVSVAVMLAELGVILYMIRAIFFRH